MLDVQRNQEMWILVFENVVLFVEDNPSRKIAAYAGKYLRSVLRMLIEGDPDRRMQFYDIYAGFMQPKSLFY